MEGAAENDDDDDEREGFEEEEEEVDVAGPEEEEEEATEPGGVGEGGGTSVGIAYGAGGGTPNSLMPKKSAAGGAAGACSCFRLAATAGGSNMAASFALVALSAPASKTSSLEGPLAATLGGATGAEGALLLFLGFGSMAASPVNGGDGSPAAVSDDLNLLDEDGPACALGVVADGAGRSRRMRRFDRVGGTGAGAGAVDWGGESESESEP